MGLKEFLVSVREGLKDLPTRKKVHIVIGNESCDLDSSVSAIVYAYFLHQIKNKPGTVHVPILNIHRDNFRLRLETVYFLGKHGIHPNDLTFASDLDLTALTSRSGGEMTLSVTLVDHHVLNERVACLWPHVERVFDHRPQDGTLPDSWTVTLERVGSCCSLIAQELLSSDVFQLDSVVAELLLGTILTDTGNMSASDNIGTPEDHEQLVRLKAFLPPSISATSIFEEIQKAKFDLSSLTVREMLEKDMKILKGNQVTVVMSSITKDLEEIMSDPDFSQHVREFCDQLPANAVILMTLMKGDGGIRRRCIAVYSPSHIYREQISDVLMRSTSPNLDLQPLTSPAFEGITAFVQNNLGVSRKGVLPLLRDFVAGETGTASSSNVHDIFSSDFSDNAAVLPSSSSEGPGEGEHHEEMRRHINLAKASHSEQFRTSQDRFDLVAVGNEPLISPSLSSDSDIGNLMAVSNFSLSHPDLPIAETLLGGVATTSGSCEADHSGDVGGNSSTDNLLIDFGAGGDSGASASNNAQSGHPPHFFNTDNVLVDLSSGDGQLAAENSVSNNGAGAEGDDDFGEARASPRDPSSKEPDAGFTNGTGSSGNINTPPIVINCQEQPAFELICRPNISDSMMTDFYSTSMPTSGQGSKVPSYPDTPPNSYVGSSFNLNRETQLPSFNSSEMVKRIQQKKAALSGHSGPRRSNYDEDDDDRDGLAITGVFSMGSSGGGGSLISPAVPQNSFIDSGSGFDFMSGSSPGGGEIPRLTSSDSLMERVNEKRSQFEWAQDDAEGKDADDDDDAGASSNVIMRGDSQGGGSSLDPPVPYTPQNSYIEGGFDSYARANLPSMNSAEMVAKMRAKQSAMFGSSGSSSRVSHSSQGSEESPGCASPAASGSDAGGRSVVSNKVSRGASLDSPQPAYTPHNSYRDSMGLLEYRSRLPDLNEVAERLSTERGKEQTSEDKDEGERGNNTNPITTNLQPAAPHGPALLGSSSPQPQPLGLSGRKSSSRSHSDSQNTMSDVDSLMSVSTDVGTPLTENVVATGLAGQILRGGESRLLGRKDTTDSDVFVAPPKEDEHKEKGSAPEAQDGAASASQDDSRKHLKFNLNHTGNSVVVPNGPVADEDLIYPSGGDAREGFVPNSLSKDELFSPVEPTREDLGFVDIAENIVAESIAAALQVSCTGPGEGVRWSDQQVSTEAVVSPENVVAANLSASILHEGSDRWQLCQEEEKKQNTGGDREEENEMLSNMVSQNIAQDMMTGEANHSSVAGSNPYLQQNKKERNRSNNDRPNKNPHHPPGGLDQAEEVPDQSVSDAALNELAYEIAQELIQNVLENFPEISSQMEGQEREGQHGGDASGNNTEAAAAPSRRFGVVDNALTESSSPGESVHEKEDTVSPYESSSVPPPQSSCSDPRKLSTDSTSSAGTSSSDRKWSRDTDSAMTILEDEVVSSFPGRPEQEEEIKSFPGRKFSKSDDFPARRFSREEAASRRASKLGEQGEAGGPFAADAGDEFEDIKVAPDGLETDYLPNMDPLQGNIMDAAFAKITDVDKEVVEGESFRKVSGHELGGMSRQFTEEEEVDQDGEGRGVLQEQVMEIPQAMGGSTRIAGSSESAERGIMKKDQAEGGGDSVFGEGGDITAVKAPKVKKRIRVSFSEDIEDIEDEIGESNASTGVADPSSSSSHSPSRSVLRSPPPFAPPQDPALPGGSEERECGGGGEDDDGLADLHGGRQHESREVYHTTAGRISIPSGDFDDDRPGGSTSSPSDPARQHQHIALVTRDGHQVGQVSEATDNVDVFDVLPRPTQISDPARPNSHDSTDLKTQNLDSSQSETTALTAQDSPNTRNPRADSLTFFQSPETYTSPASDDTITASHTPVLQTQCVEPLHADFTTSHVTLDPGVTPLTPNPSVTPDPSHSVVVSAAPTCHDPQPACDVSSDATATAAADVASATDSQTVVVVSRKKSAKSPRLSQMSGPQPATSDPLTSESRAHSRNPSSTSFGSIKDAVYSDEWQDDDIAGIAAQSGIGISPDDHQRKKIRPDPNFARHIADGDDDIEEEEDDDNNGDDDDDDDGLDNRSDITDLEWENDTPIQPQARPSIQPTLSHDGPREGGGEDREESDVQQRWMPVSVSGFNFNIDMRAVDPYRGVLSHGGYYAEGLNAIIVFYGCNLPTRRLDNYSYIMNHLFHYVVHTLEELVADDYVIVYFHGSTPRHKMPGLGWLRRCYQSIDRRLKKNLKGLFLVHPTLWLRTIVTMTRPFISSKFSSKLRFVKTLEELNSIVPMDNVTIPDAIAHYDIHHRHLPSPPTTPGQSPGHSPEHQQHQLR